MPAIRLTFDKLLEERGISRYRLASEVKTRTGLGESTVYGALRGQFLPRLDTLAVMMGVFEDMTGKPVELSEVLEYDRAAPNPPPPKPFSTSGRRKQDKE